MEALRESWMHFVLMAAQKYKPVVIVLDAINQLSPEHGALDLAWLPYSLPKDPCVRIFCSMIKVYILKRPLCSDKLYSNLGH